MYGGDDTSDMRLLSPPCSSHCNRGLRLPLSVAERRFCGCFPNLYSSGRSWSGGRHMAKAPTMTHEPADLRELLSRALVLRQSGSANLEESPIMPSSNEVERGPAVALEPALALMLSRMSEANINQLLRGASMFWPLSHGCMLALNAPLPTPAGTPGLYSGGMTALAGAKAGVKVGCKRRRACSVAGEIGDTVEDGGSGPVGGEAHTAANAGQSGCGGGGKRPRLSMWRRRKQRRAEAATAASTAASGGPQPLPLLSPSLPLPLLPPRSQTLTVTDEAKSVEVGCGTGTFSEVTCGGDARGRGGSARDGDDAVRPGGARRQGRRWMRSCERLIRRRRRRFSCALMLAHHSGEVARAAAETAANRTPSMADSADATLRSTKPISGNAPLPWSTLARFVWGVCAAVLGGCLRSKANLKAFARALCRGPLLSALHSKSYMLPASFGQRLRTSVLGPVAEILAGRGGSAGTGDEPAAERRGCCAALQHAAKRKRLMLMSRWAAQTVVGHLRPLVLTRSPTRRAEAHLCEVWERRVWKRAARAHLRAVRKASLQPLTHEQAAALFADAGRDLGVARLTVVPKGRNGTGGLRTIHQLHQPAPIPKACRASRADLSCDLNTALQHLLPLLSAVTRDAPTAHATSVLGMSEVHARWRMFVCEMRHLVPTAPLAFTSTDLAGCYDTISQPRLLQAVAFALRLSLRGTATSTVVHSRLLLSSSANPQALTRSVTTAVAAATPCDVGHVVVGSIGGGGSDRAGEVGGNGRGGGVGAAAAARFAAGGSLASGRVLSEHPIATSHSMRHAFALLRQHLLCHTVESGGVHYASRMGIPQVGASPRTCCLTLRRGGHRPTLLPCPHRLVLRGLSFAPQGSVVSARLCSLHLGAADHATLARFLPSCAPSTTNDGVETATESADVPTGKPLMQLRVIDDTLQVTTASPPLTVEGSSAHGRASRSGSGSGRDGDGYGGGTLRMFGMVPNQAKARATSGLGAGGDNGGGGGGRGETGTGGVHDSSGRLLHPWCGWLIDVSSLEVRPQFARGTSAVADCSKSATVEGEGRPRGKRAGVDVLAAGSVVGVTAASRSGDGDATGDGDINCGRRDVGVESGAAAIISNGDSHISSPAPKRHRPNPTVAKPIADGNAHAKRSRTSAASRVDRRPRDGQQPYAKLETLVQTLFRAARPKLSLAFVDPQINTAVTCRRNFFLACLYALVTARADLLRGHPPPLMAALGDFIRSASAYARAQQTKACRVPPVGPGGSRRLAGCEGEYLGWAAIELLAKRRPATLGRHAMRRDVTARLERAARRCSQPAQPGPQNAPTSVPQPLPLGAPMAPQASTNDAVVSLLRLAAVSDGFEIVTGWCVA